MVKAAFFDIDGTIVSFRTHSIPEGTWKALWALHDKGVKLVVSSGRPEYLIDNVRGFPFDAVISCNGAIATIGGKTVFKCPIDHDDAIKAAQFCVESGITSYVFAEKASGINCMDPNAAEIRDLLNIQVPDYCDIVELCRREEILEMTTYVTKEQEDKFLMPVLGNVQYIRWHPKFTDINPADADKGIALRRIMEHWGMTADEAIAFGDGGNDIPMLKAAGIGVAMGGSTAQVQSNADYLTASVDEDGVLKALQHFGIL